jgi:nucleotide-binding universal stress UspA family protein
VLDVLAYCSNPHAWTPGVRYAAELAASLGASLTGLHVAPPWPSREPRGAPPSLMAELLAHAQEEVRAATQAGPHFDAWARGIGVGSTRWHVALGDPRDVLGVAGNWADLIVIDRRIGDRDDTSDLISELLLSHRVCIAVPDNGYALTRFERVMIIHDGSPSAIRALHAALPLLRDGVRAIVLAIDRPIAEDAAPHPDFDPLAWLVARGIDAELQRLDVEASSVAGAVLDASASQRIDLLVCGASGKRRLDDCRLDEIPRHLLAYSDAPILMAH